MFSHAIIKNTKSEKGEVVFSRYYNLPDRRVLFFTSDRKQGVTILKVFSMDNLKKRIAFRRLQGAHSLLCIFPDGSFLLGSKSVNDNCFLRKICSKTLKPLATQSSKPLQHVGVIDNERFFTITRPNFVENNQKYFLTIYEDNNGIYIKSENIQLSFQQKDERTTVSSILSLGKNRYCCHFAGLNSDEFSVLIFEINIKTRAMTELGVIKPAGYTNFETMTSGAISVLPNHQLLTYNLLMMKHTWDTIRLSALKMGLNEINSHDKFSSAFGRCFVSRFHAFINPYRRSNVSFRYRQTRIERN